MGDFVFEKKSHSGKKSERGDLLVSPGIVCYAKKHKKLFWFSSLRQMFQFGTKKFRRTFRNSFGQFVWTKKKSHYNVTFHFMNRRLKTTDGVIVSVCIRTKVVGSKIMTVESDFWSTFLSLPVKSLVLNSERSYREDSKSERHLSTFFGSNLNNNGLEICT